MSARLEGLIASSRARELDGAWDCERSERVRAGVARRREVKSARERLLRRGAFVVGGAGLLVVLLLRVASSAPAEPLASVTPASAPTAAIMAARTLDDAGYVRD